MKALEKQTNYEVAFRVGLERARSQSPAALAELGASETADGCYDLPVLDAAFSIDLKRGTVTLRGGGEAAPITGDCPRLSWKILAIHYLCARPSSCCAAGAPARVFADFPDARGYEKVYKGRVLGRLCATVGRERTTFVNACRRLRAEPVESADEGFLFRVFPRVSVVIAWYEGDDEFPPGASFLYPDDIVSFLPMEDVIVLSEGLVSRLQGKGW